jgi:chemotaxis protein CheZ
MSPAISSQELADRIDDAQRRSPSLEGVSRNVTALMSAWPSDKGLYPQLKRLAAFIEQTKAEIAALRPDEVKLSFLPTATDELDAIVAATADATTRIMDAGDKLMEIAGELTPEQNERVMTAVMSIYEACSFQDITGQRITKVVKTLKVIEQRIDHMITSALGDEVAAAPADSNDNAWDAVAQDLAETGTSDASLLNGPALPGQGRTQAEIDALLGFS